MTIDIETVATDGDLENEIGGPDALRNLRTELARSSTARRLALADVLLSLKFRTPPILESDIADPTELNQVVVYGALAKLYLQNVTTGDAEDVNFAKHKLYEKQYSSRLYALRPTVPVSLRSAPGGIAFHRW